MNRAAGGVMYKISYAYVNPSNAGPFKGKALTATKYGKGDQFYAVMGLAQIVSCRKVTS
jgi:hypothetical protein